MVYPQPHNLWHSLAQHPLLFPFVGCLVAFLLLLINEACKTLGILSSLETSQLATTCASAYIDVELLLTEVVDVEVIYFFCD